MHRVVYIVPILFVMIYMAGYRITTAIRRRIKSRNKSPAKKGRPKKK